MKRRTDLALESRELYQENNRREPEGVDWQEEQEGNILLTRVYVRNRQGAEALEKPVGAYITADLGPDWDRDLQGMERAAAVIARELAALLPPNPACVLAAGLGNRRITADALGPLAMEKVIVTRHLKDAMPQAFEQFARVGAVSPGVLGVTGIETGEILQGVCRLVKPDAVIAVDALASRRLNRLCRTVQLSDSGITPGGGVGPGRAALDRDSLGAPVIAIGVPMVVDAWTLAMDLCQQAGGHLEEEDCPAPEGAMIVAPKDIDALTRKSAKLIGYAINMALHNNLSISEIEELLS